MVVSGAQGLALVGTRGLVYMGCNLSTPYRRYLEAFMGYYEINVEGLNRQYNSCAAVDVHAGWCHFLPRLPSRACDIGTGSSCDANWLACLGWQVTAVEPYTAMRERVKKARAKSVQRCVDTLPHLSELQQQAQEHGLHCVDSDRRNDVYGRHDVCWEAVCFSA